jgi:hypothetical protein
LASTPGAATVKTESSGTPKLSAVATGGRFTCTTVICTVVVSVPPLGSLTA